MSWLREIKLMVRRIAKAEASRVRTCTVGQITEYDATRNAVKIRLCVKAMRTEDPENLTTVEMPILEDIPVQQFGSGKLLFSVPPSVDSYGTLFFSDRDLEAWLTSGGIVDPANMRKWDLSDAIFCPGLYPFVVDGDNGQIEEAIATDRVSMRTRSGLTEISVLADESVTIVTNEDKASIVIDKEGKITIVAAGDVSIDTEGKTTIASKGDVLIDTDGKVTTSASETVLQDGTDWAVQFTALKSAFDTLKGDFNNFLNITYNLHMHPTAAVGAPSVPTIIGTPTAADMSGAKVQKVRVP
jgi:hypothetical protein